MVFCVVFSFALFVACSDKNNSQSSLNTIADIYAADVNIVYDGRPHSIVVNNTLSSDTILYSTDGNNFSESSPVFVLPDTYTVFFKVIRSGYTDFSSSATVTITPSILDGISAPNATVIYDGLSHSVSVNGALSTDKITYSTDGATFSSGAPSFTDIGVHTVYYHVQRVYGDYESSCTLTILPNILGRYFNPSFGLIVIDRDCAYVNSVRQDVTVGIDGSGYLSSESFSVSDSVLNYNSLSFTALTDGKYVYKLTSSTASRYFCYSADGELNITFENDICVVKLDDQTLLSVPDVNYCESAHITDYAELTFEQAFIHSSDITEINVSFSLRDTNPFVAEYKYYTYDGLPHGLDFSVPVVFPDDTEPTFTEIGKHTVTAIILSDKYLPLVAECTLIIMPDIDGTYFSTERILKIDDKSVYIDGEYSGKLSTLDENWTYDGMPITITVNGLTYDGEEYTTADLAMVVCINNEITSRIALQSDIKQICISFDRSSLVFTNKTNILLTVPIDSNSVSIVSNGNDIVPVSSDSNNYFILGTTELDTDIIFINVSTE